MNWLILDDVFQTIERARGLSLAPSMEYIQRHEALYPSSADIAENRLLRISNGVANISVSGVLTNRPDFLASMFGGGNTTYSDIIGAIVRSEQDESVDSIVLHVDSPGGTVDGLFNAISAIQKATKPVIACVDGTAASAAYALVAQADSINAVNSAARIGSVGVVASFAVDDKLVSITSTESPDKYPDIKTDEGRAVVIKELDAIYELFVDAIAEGRGVESKQVVSGFGRGGVSIGEGSITGRND